MVIDNAVKSLLRRDRWIVLGILGAVIAVSWAYILAGAGMGMSALEMMQINRLAEPMGEMAMAPMAWSPGYAVLMFFMWWIMMIAMMLPSATPMILLFAAVNRRQRQQGNPYVSTAIFTASYLIAWAGFSLGAVVLHWALRHAGLIAPSMVVTSQLLGAALLIAAGLYQITPIKQACLRHCRHPAQFLVMHWRKGAAGAVRMGFAHGAYCLGCCWMLMLLLFFGGVMNLFWIAGLAVYVLLEKTIAASHWVGYGLGAILASAGAWLLILLTISA